MDIHPQTLRSQRCLHKEKPAQVIGHSLTDAVSRRLRAVGAAGGSRRDRGSGAARRARRVRRERGQHGLLRQVPPQAVVPGPQTPGALETADSPMFFTSTFSLNSECSLVQAFLQVREDQGPCIL